MAKSDDQRLLRDLRAGRSEAGRELVRSHHQAVYRFLFQLSRDVHRAEDLTQETFRAAWERIESFEGRSSLATWLHRIAYTKFIDSQRAESRTAMLQKQIHPSEFSTADPIKTLIDVDESRRLNRAMDELKTADRTVLVLHYLQGLSYSEMASVLDEPSGTVKWRTREALNCLRLLLKE